MTRHPPMSTRTSIPFHYTPLSRADVLSHPERYGRNYVARLAGSMAVPAMVSQMASATDPNLREARNILDTIKSRVPGLSDELPERLDLWGQPLARGKS